MKLNAETIRKIAPDVIVIEHTSKKGSFFVTLMKGDEEFVFDSSEIELAIDQIEDLNAEYKVTHSLISF